MEFGFNIYVYSPRTTRRKNKSHLGIERVQAFRVRVTTPLQYERNGTAHTADASILSPARGVFAGVRGTACGGPGGLPLGSATHFHSVATATQPAHRLQICPIVHN